MATKFFNPLTDVKAEENPLDLYEWVPGWLEATKDIIAIIAIARKEFTEGEDPYVAYKEVRKVLHKYEPWGATDTEPEIFAAKFFTRGFDLEADEFC